MARNGQSISIVKASPKKKPNNDFKAIIINDVATW